MPPSHSPGPARIEKLQQRVEITLQRQLATRTYLLRFRSPELAQRIVPGQFVMLKLAGWNDPLLGRPLALYDVKWDPDGLPTEVEVVYLVMGKMTRRLADLQPGQMLDVWGPLGNGFPISSAAHLVMVAGGIGQTPFLALGKETLGRQQYGGSAAGCARRGSRGAADGQQARVTLLYGARSADLLAGVDDFRAAGMEVKVCTDDGSAGESGLVTELLATELGRGTAGKQVVCCGPEPMMHAVSTLAQAHQVPCWVSLETPMACGIGICFTCVARVRQSDGSWDYRRTCVEGPVFEAQQIVW